MIEKLLAEMVAKGVSDIFIIAGRRMSYKLNNSISSGEGEILRPQMTRELITEIYALADGRDMQRLMQTGDDDFAFSISGLSRFRANVYKQRGSLAAVIRVIAFSMPDPEKLHIPMAVLEAADAARGLILVTGSAGSGKSTTLACMIEHINTTREAHIITLEDPIEFLHSHKRSIISQREITLDTQDYDAALRSAMRQSPDVILIGELRDPSVIFSAMAAAETGHLVISTMHTVGAANTIERMIDSFAPSDRNQARIQLSMVLRAVISQQLANGTDGELHPAFEIMYVNNAVRTMIREGRTHQINSAIKAGAIEGMRSMDDSLIRLYEENQISEADALLCSLSPNYMTAQLKAIKK